MVGSFSIQGALSNVLRGAGGALVLVMYDELKVSAFLLLGWHIWFVRCTYVVHCDTSCAPVLLRYDAGIHHIVLHRQLTRLCPVLQTIIDANL